MKSIKIAGLALVAVFAFSAIVAGSAFATPNGPEYKLCAKAPKVEKKYTGEYSDKGCTTEATEGKYKLEEVAEGTAFSGKSKASTFTIAGKVIKCKKDTVTGSILNQFRDTDKIIFSSCTVNGNKSEPCGNVAPGTIETAQLESNLYFVNEAETQPGIALNGEEGVFAEFKCGAETIVIEGVALGTITGGKGITATFAVSGGHQAIQEIWLFEHSFKARLESNNEEVTLETTEEEKPATKGVGVFF